MLHLPEVLPDETLYSLLARIAAINGMADHLRVFELLFGHTSPTSIVRISNGIERFCSLTQGAYGTVNVIRSKWTIFPLLRHLDVFPSPSLKANPGKVTWLCGSTFDYSGNTRNEWHECPECRSEDEATMGFSYWRRSHQLPTSYYCATHGKPLKRSIIPGRQLHDRFWLPHELDFQAAPEPGSVTIKTDVAMALATIGREALNDFDEPYPPDVIRGTFYSAIKDRCLLTRAGKMRWQECLNDFYKTTKLVEASTIIPGLWICQLLIGLQEPKRSVPIQHYVLLVYWLFGTWKSFKESCNWVATINYPVRNHNSPINTSSRLIKNQQFILAEYRQVCINYLHENPNATRAQFLDHEYKCFRWLKGNDPEWLNLHLPLSGKSDIQKSLF